MARFFVSASNIFGGVAVIGGEDAAHAKVLRLRVGETVYVCDGSGVEHTCRITRVERDELEAEIVSSAPGEAEPDVFCRVLAAYPKGDKAEHIVQKSVELGAGEIVFFPSSRCVSRPSGAAVEAKRRRWQKIAEEAAKQCGRAVIPKVRALQSFDEALCEAAACHPALLLYEGEKSHSLRQEMEGRKPARVSLMTGPEGGFAPEEVERACAAGLVSCSLGRRILRCETAPLCALTAVMLLTGNL